MSRFAIKERQTLGIIVAGQRPNRNNKTLFSAKAKGKRGLYENFQGE